MNRKRIVAIHGHPRAASYNRALAEAYLDGARSAGASVAAFSLDDLAFDPILHDGYATPQPLEPDLVRVQQAIEQADHVVVSFPVWWGAPPALLKGFFDRTFLPGWAFSFRGWWPLPTPLLQGRTGHVVITLDAPTPIYSALYLRSAHRSVVTGTLRFCGIGPVTQMTVGAVKYLPAWMREAHLERSHRLGREHASRRGTLLSFPARRRAS